MTRWLGALVCVLALVACSANDNGGAIGKGPVTKEQLGPAGQLRSLVPANLTTLRVGAAVDRAPILFYGTGTKTPEGIEQDLLQAIARQLGINVKVTNYPLGGLGAALISNQIDVIAGGFVDIKAFEGAGIDFIDDLTGRSSVLVRQGNPAKVGGPDDLCGRTVGLVAGTAQQVAAVQLDAACKSRGRSALNLRAVADHEAALADLTGSRSDALLDDSVVAQYTAQVSSGATTVEVAGAAVDPMPYGFGVLRTNATLRNAVQQALLAVIRDGEYDAAVSKWGGDEDALRSAAIDTGQ